ncbi:MAG: heavy-metal-associated domain-containing protein [Bacillota bacterium]|nr:heavy-metal-associated domain-containing protein [Bacillota bacterium]MDP4169473.1 heavy-metal-associated domain-containing protein [Bacillota bacterium]
MEKGLLKIKNLKDDQDAKTIVNALNHVWGIEKIRVDVNNQEAVYTYDNRMAAPEDFVQAVKDLGYEIREN